MTSTGSKVAKVWPGGKVTPSFCNSAASAATGSAALAIKVVSGVTTAEPAFAVMMPTLLPVNRSVPPMETSFQPA